VNVVNSGQVGVGGYRMYKSQYTYKLGQELAARGAPGQLTFIDQNSFSRILAVKNRGYNPSLTAQNYFTYNNFGIANGFKPLYNATINDNDIWKKLLCGPQVPLDSHNVPLYENITIPGFGNMNTTDYLQWVAANVIAPSNGPEVAQYLLDGWRFRGDFDPRVDAYTYLDYVAKDYTGAAVVYPVPSYKPFFEIMSDQITSGGGHIYLNEKVLSVNTQASGPRYKIVTSKQSSVTANSVIFATNHSALMASDPNDPSGGMTGDVVSQIVGQSAYQHVFAVNSIQVAHQFGDGAHPNTGWWHGDIRYPNNGQLLGGQLSDTATPIRRTTNNIAIAGDLLPGCTSSSCDFRNTSFFNNTNELPLTDYHDWINVSRTMYNDDTPSVEDWIRLYNAGGVAAVNKQLLKSLRVMHPTVFTGDTASEPPIRATQVVIHKPAWYYLTKGSFGAGWTTDTVSAWSLNPIAGERVYLVGDSWLIDGSGWSDGAYRSSIHVLNKYFGTNIDPKDLSRIQCVNGDIHDPN